MIGATDIFVRNPSVRMHSLEEGAILHDPFRKKVVTVNSFGAALWTHCDGNTSVSGLNNRLGKRYGVSPGAVGAAMRNVAGDLLDHGLLHLSAERANDGQGATSRAIAFHDHQVKVRSRSERGLAALEGLFQDMIVDGGTHETIEVLNLTVQDDKLSIQGLNGLATDLRPPRTTMRRLKQVLLERFMQARSDLIWLHAGAIARDDSAVVVVGDWGSGKSTVVANLIEAGWTYLSDDVVPYDPQTGKVEPFPVTPEVRRSHERELARERVSGLRKWPVDLQEARVPSHGFPVDSLIFPKYRPGSRSGLESKSVGEGVVGLVESCQNAEYFEGQAVNRLCDLARSTRSFQLNFDAQTSISRLIQSVGRKNGL